LKDTKREYEQAEDEAEDGEFDDEDGETDDEIDIPTTKDSNILKTVSVFLISLMMIMFWTNEKFFTERKFIEVFKIIIFINTLK